MFRIVTFSWLLLVGLICSSHAQTNDRPDFSGDWLLDLSESRAPKGEGDALIPAALTILRIDQRDPVFKVSQIVPKTGDSLSSSTFYSDGREIRIEDGNSVEITKWDGRKLKMTRKPVIKSEIGRQNPDGSVVSGGGTVTTELHIQWELSPQGRLIETINRIFRSDYQLLGRRDVRTEKSKTVKVYSRKKD